MLKIVCKLRCSQITSIAPNLKYLLTNQFFKRKTTGLCMHKAQPSQKPESNAIKHDAHWSPNS